MTVLTSTQQAQFDKMSIAEKVAVVLLQLGDTGNSHTFFRYEC